MADEFDVKDYTETISIRLTKEQVKCLREYAQTEGISQSDLIRRLIDHLDMIPNLPQGIVARIRKVASGQKPLTPAKVIERALREYWRGEWSWK